MHLMKTDGYLCRSGSDVGNPITVHRVATAMTKCSVGDTGNVSPTRNFRLRRLARLSSCHTDPDIDQFAGAARLREHFRIGGGRSQRRH